MWNLWFCGVATQPLSLEVAAVHCKTLAQIRCKNLGLFKNHLTNVVVQYYCRCSKYQVYLLHWPLGLPSLCFQTMASRSADGDRLRMLSNEQRRPISDSVLKNATLMDSPHSKTLPSVFSANNVTVRSVRPPTISWHINLLWVMRETWLTVEMSSSRCHQAVTGKLVSIIMRLFWLV